MKKPLIFIIIFVLFLFMMLCIGCTGNDYVEVRFETDGGIAVEGMKIRFNGVLDINGKTTAKEYHVFDGWYNDKDCTLPYDRNYFKKDIVVYAKWLPMFELMPDNTYCLINGYKNGYLRLDIPKEYNGKAVTSIAPEAFYMSTIQAVSIPSTVRVIGNGAFTLCVNLVSVVFEEGSAIEQLGHLVFSGCASLESIILPNVAYQNGYTEEVFSGCSNLKSIIFEGDFPKSNLFYRKNDSSSFFQLEEILMTDKIWEFDIDFTHSAWYKAQPDGIVYLNDIAYTIKAI